MFHFEYCEISMSTYYEEHLWRAVSLKFSPNSFLQEHYWFKRLNPQNGQTHSNSSNCLNVFDHFLWLVLNGLTMNLIDKTVKQKNFNKIITLKPIKISVTTYSYML